jgi:hypothetical protein
MKSSIKCGASTAWFTTSAQNHRQPSSGNNPGACRNSLAGYFKILAACFNFTASDFNFLVNGRNFTVVYYRF